MPTVDDILGPPLSKGVMSNGMLPGSEGNLDRTKAGDNWATFEISEEGIPKHYILPTQPGDKPPSGDGIEMGDAVNRFLKTKKHYGAFDTDETASAYMKAGAARPSVDDILGPEAKTAQPSPEETLASSLMHYAQGIRQGFYKIPQSVVELGARGTDALGLTKGAQPTAHQFFKDTDALAAPDQGSKYVQGGQTVGEILATAPLSGAKVLQGATAIPGALRTLGEGAIQGAGAATLTSASSDKPLGEQLGEGAAGGAIGGAVLKGASKIISPQVSKAVALLKKEGIPLTTGQQLGGSAMKAEDKAMSAPILGDTIAARRSDGIEQLNRVVLNKPLQRVGASLPDNVPAGREGVDYVARTLGDKYDHLLPNLTGKLDKPFLTAIDGAVKRVQGSLPDAQVTRLRNIVDSQIVTKAYQTGGQLDGDTLKGIESELGRMASGLKSDPSFDNRELGDAVGDIQTALRDMVERNNPKYSGELQALNQAWSEYRIAARAAASSGAHNGVFTPAQLSAAVKASDRSSGKTRFARGTAKMQDLAGAAKDVMSSKTPDSGTAGRSAALAVGSGFLSPKIPLTLGAGALAYTKPGQAVTNALMFNRPAGANALASGVSRNALALSPALGVVGGQR